MESRVRQSWTYSSALREQMRQKNSFSLRWKPSMGRSMVNLSGATWRSSSLSRRWSARVKGWSSKLQEWRVPFSQRSMNCFTIQLQPDLLRKMVVRSMGSTFQLQQISTSLSSPHTPRSTISPSLPFLYERIRYVSQPDTNCRGTTGLYCFFLGISPIGWYSTYLLNSYLSSGRGLRLGTFTGLSALPPFNCLCMLLSEFQMSFASNTSPGRTGGRSASRSADEVITMLLERGICREELPNLQLIFLFLGFLSFIICFQDSPSCSRFTSCLC